MVSAIGLVGALSTEHKVGLLVVGLVFIAFALLSSFLLPARFPSFPGRNVGWFVFATILLFIAMIAAVIVFGREKEEARAERPPATTTAPAPPSTTPSTTTSRGATTTGGGGGGGAPAVKGDPKAGKAVFASAGCNGCHTLKAANATGSVGPNLDQLKPAEDVVVHQVENGGGAMPAFKGRLTPKQIQDVAAFVYASTH